MEGKHSALLSYWVLLFYFTISYFFYVPKIKFPLFMFSFPDIAAFFDRLGYCWTWSRGKKECYYIIVSVARHLYFYFYFSRCLFLLFCFGFWYVLYIHIKIHTHIYTHMYIFVYILYVYVCNLLVFLELREERKEVKKWKTTTTNQGVL